MKKQITVLLIFLTTLTFAQTNLLDTSLWTEGTSYISEFGRYGSSHENVRELDFGPHSQTTPVLIWKAIHDPATNNTTNNTNSGGWTTAKIDIQSNKTYRFTLWVKQLNSFTPSEFFGFSAYDSNDNFLSVPRVNSTPRTNPYFGCNLPTLNEWYFLEAYIHAEGSNISTPQGKIWDASGNEVGTLADYIFPAGTVKITHKANTKNSSTSAGDQLFYYAPTIYEVNGLQPSRETLINGPNNNTTTTSTSGQSLWTQSGNNIHYNNGNIGIGNSNPIEKIHIEGNLLLDAYNQGNENGIFFREGFNNSNKYNLSILTNNNGGSSPDALSINAFDGVYFNTGSNSKNTRMLIDRNGNVGIGTDNPGTWKLAVNGKIRAKEIKVETDWADYVFLKDYKLPSLQEVEKHIKEKGHLINIPSAKEVENNGVELGEINKLLLEKIEELTLYTIQQERKLIKQEERNKKLEARLIALEKKIN
ncbi:hypothetical protein GTQ40_17770 [Flavobacteriaceae bacterium R38]|nr:hypothetical protein [Flavobacteriaceae bacterium R38]